MAARRVLISAIWVGPRRIHSATSPSIVTTLRRAAPTCSFAAREAPDAIASTAFESAAMVLAISGGVFG